MSITNLFRSLASRPDCAEFVAACLVGIALLGGCSKALRSGKPNTGGAASTGGAAGTGGASDSGGMVGAGGARDASADADSSTCDRLAGAARAQFQTYLDSTASLACQVDSDCTFLHLQSLNCIAPCGQLVGQVDTSAVTSAATHVCDQYFAAGCPEINLFCVAGRLVCDQGRCIESMSGPVDPASDALSLPSTASEAGADSGIAVDTEAACAPANEGAACTPDQTACKTCCTDRWTCSGGVWQRGFIGCLPGPFSCGDQSCAVAGTSYCQVIPAVTGGELPHPATYTCETLPSSCYGSRCPTCDCLAQAGVRFSACTTDPTGAIYVTE